MQPRVSFLRDTKTKGIVSELRVMAALAEVGYRLFVPYGENCRYDVAIEKDGFFKRMQIKTGRLRNGVVRFNGYSSHYHRRGGAMRTYEGEVDFFGVYDPEHDAAYLIPAKLVRTGGSLRVAATRNGQAKKILWTEEFLVASRPEGMVGSSANHRPGRAVVA